MKSRWQGVTTAMGCNGTIIHDDGSREHVHGCHGIYRTDHTIKTLDRDGKVLATRREISENPNASHHGFISRV